MPRETTLESMMETNHDTGPPLKIQLVFGPTGCSTGGLSVDVSSIANHLTARGHSVSVITTAPEHDKRRGRYNSPQVTTSAGSSKAHSEDQRYVRFSQRVTVQRLPHIPLGNMAGRVSLSPGSRRLTYRARPVLSMFFPLRQTTFTRLRSWRHKSTEYRLSFLP